MVPKVLLDVPLRTFVSLKRLNAVLHWRSPHVGFGFNLHIERLI